MPRHHNRRPAPTHRPLIESLENRALLAVIFADGFEGIFPGAWQVSSTGFNRTASWGDNAFQSSGGDWSAFCADNGDDFRSTYDDNLETSMSRSFSLASASAATLTFDYYLNTERGFDKFYVKARDHFGNWSTLLIDSGTHGGLGFQHTSLDLSSYAGDNNVAISFEFVSDESGVVSAPAGVWIDNVIVEADAAGDPPDTVSPGSGEWIWTNQMGDLARPSSIDSSSDVDIWAFNPDRTGSYSISTTQPLDTMLRIYDSSGQPITPIIDDFFGGESTTRNLTADNWYYIAIAGYENDTGPYTLNINGPDVIPLILDPLPGPTYNVTIEGATDYGGDVDYFQVPAPASATTLTVTPTAPFPTRVEIYNSTGTLLQSQAGGPITDFPITGGQVYYIAMLGQLRDDVGDYSLNIDFNPDEGGATAIGGTNWNDYNSNGIRDIDEPGLGGWTIYIDSDENGLLDPGEPSTLTNSFGEYQFNNLTPGSYRLREVLQPGWIQIYPVEPEQFTVQAGQIINTANFGNFPTIFNGSAANDQFTFRTSPTDSSRVEILHTVFGDTITYSISKAIYTAPQFNLGAGDDTLIFDPNADPFPFALIFDGGPGNDTLIVRNVPDLVIEPDMAVTGMENVEVDGGSVRFIDAQHISGLSIHNSGRMLLSGAFLHAGSLTILDNSNLIADGPVILDSPNIATVTNLIKSNNILSSGDISNRRLGAISNAGPRYTTFGGESGLTGGEVLVLYTIIGDLNLDKQVSIADFITLASHFNQANTTWGDGDINYDGSVTIADFIALAAQFNQSFAAASANPLPPSQSTLSTTQSILDEPLLVRSVSKVRARKANHHHRSHPIVRPNLLSTRH